MKGWLQPLAVPLSGLAALGMSRWLWVDAVGVGVHLEEAPPATRGEITLLWGWSARRAVRVRLDPGLPNGLVGALLVWGEAPAGGAQAEVVEVVESERPLWSTADNRAAMPVVPGLGSGPASTLRTIEVRRLVNETGGREVSVPLVFVYRP